MHQSEFAVVRHNLGWEFFIRGTFEMFALDNIVADGFAVFFVTILGAFLCAHSALLLGGFNQGAALDLFHAFLVAAILGANPFAFNVSTASFDLFC